MKWISLPNGLSLCVLLTLLSSCGPDQIKESMIDDPSPSQVSANVVYGTDGRLDVYQVTDDRLKKLASSTVALIKSSDLTANGAQVLIKGKSFATSMNLCRDEKFREQDLSAFCSGTLVGPDVILTAGHCIETLSDCQQTSFVFGFAVQSMGVLPKSVAASEVYRCQDIIKTYRQNAGADFALVRLDRSVANHSPLPVRPQGEVESSASLVVIGHPVGLPTKITTGGTIRSLSNSEFFVANLDTYGGNSGSAVFNLATGLIEGILVRGETDFVTQGTCNVSKVCAEGACRGEDVTRISVARPFIPSLNPPPNPPPTLPPEKFISNAQLAIPDKNTQGVLNTLQVGSIPQGRKVFVNVQIKHKMISDLIVKVISSDGKNVIVHQRAGGLTKDLNKSYDVTSSLGKVNTAGLYKIIVQDIVAKNSGTLVSWGIEFR